MMGELIRYTVTLTVWVDATSEDEAQLILERHLAGCFDSKVIKVSSPNGAASMKKLRLTCFEEA